MVHGKYFWSWMITAMGVGMVINGCGQHQSPNPLPKAKRAQIIHIYPTASGTESAGGPESNGTLWVLAGSASAQAVYPLLLTQATVGPAIPLPASASTVALVPNGPLAVGLASMPGAVQWRTVPNAKLSGSLALPGPVVTLAAGTSGSHIYALWKTSAGESVGQIRVNPPAVVTQWPVPANTVSLVPGPQGAHLYTLTSAGQVTEWAIATHQAVGQFVVGQSGRSLAVNPAGTVLYALKGRGTVRNVAVVSVATESVKKVLPAPADSLQILISPDGRSLYVVVGDSAMGNVQTITGLGGSS